MNTKKVMTLLFLLSFSGVAFAGSTPPPAKSTAKPSAAATTTNPEAIFNKKAQDFYKQHIELQKNLLEQRKQIQKDLAALTIKKQSVRDQGDKKRMENQIADLQKKTIELNERSATENVKASEFGIEVAQHRLEAAKQALAKIQQLKKNPPPVKK